MRTDCKFATGTDYSQVPSLHWLCWLSENGFSLGLALRKSTSISPTSGWTCPWPSNADSTQRQRWGAMQGQDRTAPLWHRSLNSCLWAMGDSSLKQLVVCPGHASHPGYMGLVGTSLTCHQLPLPNAQVGGGGEAPAHTVRKRRSPVPLGSTN